MTHTPARVNVNNGFGTTNDDIPVTSDVVLAITETLRSAGCASRQSMPARFRSCRPSKCDRGVGRGTDLNRAAMTVRVHRS